MKHLTNNEVIERITDGRIGLRLSILIATTPKKYVIYTKDTTLTTNDINRTLKSINPDEGSITIINAKEYKKQLLSIE